MLDKQILKDQQGTPMGVFIPMQSWNNLVVQYPDIETLDTDLPQWEKDFIDKRLDMTQHYPERLKPVEMLFKTL
jgi:formylmethanofuran dehydrogenase subunit D